ncbi:MAG: DNA repair protein RecN [Roseburia sp.]
MLQSLHVKNLALIDETEVHFSEGLNILSGETGAGKSILIGSINLALGEKIQKEMLRENSADGTLETALVELVFSVTDKRQIERLAELSVYPEEDQVILSRKIVNGRGAARVNAETVPASLVREIAEILIDIHGQHAHQSLLSKKRHLEILDDYAGEELFTPKERLKEAYQTYRSLKEEQKGADASEEEQLRERAFLEYEIKEIEAAALREGEDEELEAQYRRFRNGKKIMEAAGNAYRSTGGGNESASELTGRALRELGLVSGYDEKLKGLEEQLLEIDNLLNDFNRELADYVEDTEFDDEAFAELEQRLNELNRLKAKYKGSIPQILDALKEKKKRYEALADYDTYLKELQRKIIQAEKDLRKCCDVVSHIRKKYAKQLTAAVTEALLELNFLDVKFLMQFDEAREYSANGLDDAEFLISTNPGEPVKPLGRIASGGELSRIMLALKTVLADHDAVETLIFDEIDSGISGRTAQMVSEKMNVLGRNHQIICITHLPQIAAMADSHYLIEKSVKNGTTISTIRRLTDKESVGELARMLGGVEITETVRKSAEEMKELANKQKSG